MRAVFAVLFIQLASSLASGAEPRYVVQMLDPRVVAVTEDTLPIEWGNKKTDVIATRKLLDSEAKLLLNLLKEELTTSTDVPFCGHHPAYAVQEIVDGKVTNTATLCGLCHTWARGGKLRVIKGDKSLNYLNSLLPLPDVFKGIKLRDMVFDEHPQPFYEMTRVAAE
ncbi:hypothetical protein KOR34_35450 [Posidoniimonas corsicana]|uniref:Cytochrome c domain-containing protein n=1 Tax=Posidoniimonas corsicana TaxID=1938618 RepID=A0A5C5V7J6_9BACT|nr:hypothetical protein [Posidoniimonas corsicana]TWT33712.1 hypothetical protein KOR34_35450 [Posidoniimonas corsicana]